MLITFNHIRIVEMISVIRPAEFEYEKRHLL